MKRLLLIIACSYGLEVQIHANIAVVCTSEELAKYDEKKYEDLRAKVAESLQTSAVFLKILNVFKELSHDDYDGKTYLIYKISDLHNVLDVKNIKKFGRTRYHVYFGAKSPRVFVQLPKKMRYIDSAILAGLLSETRERKRLFYSEETGQRYAYGIFSGLAVDSDPLEAIRSLNENIDPQENIRWQKRSGGYSGTDTEEFD